VLFCTDAERIAREDPLFAMKHKVVDEANRRVLKDVSSGAASQFQLVSDGEDSGDNEPMFEGGVARSHAPRGCARH
jgi:hypothetical protein